MHAAVGVFQVELGTFKSMGLFKGIQGLGFRESGLPKIRGALWGVPRIRIIVFGRQYWGPLLMETTNY